MKITEEQIERANRVNLPEYLMSHGFELKRAGKEYVWKEHDSLHIKDNGSGERGQWFRFSENKGGDNIDFLREYMGMSFAEAVESLTGEQIDHTYTPQKLKQQSARDFSLAEADNTRRVFAYLCKTRGLNYDLVASLVRQGMIAQEEKTGNVLFKYFDTDGKVIGAEKVGTSTNQKFKGIAVGSAGGYGFEVLIGSGEKAFFFESAIDLLSYLQFYGKEADNYRLVSMMGVKPQTVIDTMKRNKISPDNVFLCSDNDTAGNEFAEKLMTEYPEMKRIKTPDTYKDWNDMLRDIPKAEQKTKEVQPNMQTYGNRMWNDATDNRDKSLVTISIADFPKFQEQLENSGINYYGYARDISVIMAINDKDLEWFRRIADTPDLETRKSNRPYSPPEKNIFGSAEYRYIPQKEYFSAERDLVLKMAEIMSERGMQFSGRVYSSGKGTLTVSHADLYAVRNIRDEVLGMRNQFATPEKAQDIGNRDYRANSDTQYYMSKLTPEQFQEVRPFMETGVDYHAVSRDGKVAFAVDKENASAFHRALDNAVHEVGMVHAMSELGLTMEQNIALSPTIHRLAAENMPLNLADFFDSRYDDAQFGEMLSLVEAYIAQPVAERYGEHSKLSDMLEAKSSFDRSIELSDFFSQHEFSDEQRAAVSAMFVGDVTRGQIDSIDETFTVEDIQAYDEILHNALQESDVADFLTAHKQTVIDRENTDRVPTEEEVLFPQADLAKFLAERTLSSDEWEDMAYPLFERGYLENHKPSDKAAFGYHLSEPALYDIAQRYHDGEDIRRELALGLLENGNSADIEFVFEDGKISDRTYYYAENLRHSLHTERIEDGFQCSFGGMERFVSFEEIGQAFIDRTHEEFDDLAFWWVRDDMLEAVPDISDEKIADLISAFDGAIMHGWENGDNQPKINRIKQALNDILGDEAQTEKAFAVIAKEKYHVSFEPEQKESSIHFGLFGNGVTAYDVSRTDPETHDYPIVAHISAEGVIDRLDESLSDADKARIGEQAQSVRAEYMEKLNAYSNEEKTEKPHGTFRIMQLSHDDELKYHGIRFFSKEFNDKQGVQLNHSDYTQVYEGDLSDYSEKNVLESIYGRMNYGEKPEGYTGHSLSVSDVIVTNIDGNEKAYYCDDVGFTDFPEFFLEKEKAQEKSLSSVADLEVGDIIMYEGKRREVEEISEKSILLKDLDAPDFGGILLGTSDILAYDGWREDMERKGFEILSKGSQTAEKSEPEDKGPVSLRKVGDSYEMYYENAEIGAEILGLDMQSRNGMPLVEFSADAKDEYSKKLSDAGYSVLIEQAFELNPPKREAEKLHTLQDVVDKYFGTDCESAETEKGTWKLAIADGDKVGELFYGGEPVCAIYNRVDKMEIEPYSERTTFPKLLQTAMLEHNPDKPVEIIDFQRTFETPLDKAKWLINDFTVSEFEQEEDFADLHNIGLAFTTLTDDELPIQVTADLIDLKITYEFDGEVFKTEEYSDIEEMIENGLTGLDFDDLISVPDEVIERHTKKEEQTVDASTADIDKPLFSDAAVIDEIQKNENSDVPFMDAPILEGEQLTLFGDAVPYAVKTEKKKSEFAEGPFVDGVQVYEALAAEIDRGTGFVNGKLRVQEFYDKQHPTTQQLAEFLKKEYGIGGHSGEGKISLVDYDSKGMTFSFENGEKYRHTWYNVATMTKARLEDHTYLSEEQRSAYEQMKAEKSDEKTADTHDTIEIGDRFRNRITGDVCEVVSLTGALPYITDDCTVSRQSGAFQITENISYNRLFNADVYEYLGRNDVQHEQPDTEHTAELPEPKNLSQLKKSIKEGMMFEITDHLRPECIGERRVVTGVTTVDFTSRKLDENGEPTGKDLHMEFDRAKNWSFDGAELTSRLDNGDILMSFHFIDSFEHTKEAEIAKHENAAPELSVGDFLEYKGKEYKVESLDMGGFITLADTALEDAPRISSRVTFIADEFIKSGEYKVIKAKTADTPDKSDNFTITDDALGEGGAKAKFRANTDAIRTLKTLEREKRPATAEEKETMSKYVGWGAIPQAFDKSETKWSAEYKELSELLTPAEYRQARSTVGDAFFTSPTIIEGIYEALEKFGFEGGNVLEPSMGVGNFFGCMPSEMQEKSNLYGVEIDSISGRIAQKLYPDADIAIQGFEKNSFQNGCFDAAVGNVPFGDLAFKDDKHGTSKLHDYFFAEALDKVKNGGILAFVTSSGTLDKKDESVRQILADQADLIGAIRLPGGKNGAFHDNAGTDVTTDIIFLQKHDGKSVAEMSDIPDWVHIGETADGLPINQYFENHPDMVLGEVIKNTNPRGGETMVIAEDGFDLKTALHNAVSKLSAEISHERGRDVYAKTADGVQVQIPSNLRNYSFFMSDDQVFFKKNNAACEFRFDKGTAQHKRFTAFIELRDTTRDLIEAMELNKPDSVINHLQEKLNTAYDDFYKKYGLIHSQTNKRYFSEDVSYNLVAGLEKSYDKTKLIEKSDIFTKRTIMPPKAVDHVDTALEALTLSIAEKAKVDFEYMSSLTGMTEDELKHELTGRIFKIPHTENTYQTDSEYLSGDIRVKLREAEEIAEYDPDFNINVSALKQAMPEPLKAGDIDVKIGATWIDPKYYDQFMYELFQTPGYQRSDSPAARWNKSSIIGVEYSALANSFHVSNKSSDRSVLATQKYGSHKMNAYDIFEHILNLQDPKVYMTVEVPDGMGDTKEKRVVDIDATRVVQRKADDIRKAFKAWIFKDPQRREAIVQRYNELFNSIRPREYDGSALSFPMMTSDITLHDHQKNAIAHAMFGGNTLFAHCVGAGKTYEMIATSMESKRLGLCTKSLFAVPNHLTEQIGDDFQKLYPAANILVATKKDFKKENRQQLFAKIATGNYDAVIIGHSQLGMIPVSKERQEMTIQAQIDDILRGIEELKKSEGSRFQIKAMERSRKSLQKQLDKLQKVNQDNTLTFEQLGVDRLFVDECHEYKNLFVSTKLQNVAGISNSASQKALDLFLKCQYLDEKTDGKGVVFASGTPLSNSITELHTMMRYLEYGFLSDHGLQHFDNWVSVFGEQKTDWELKPAGNGFKERTRIANYTGLPELMSMFKQVADIRTADTLKLDVPECDYQVVNVDATEFQKELVQELADRADAINAGNVDPSIDNMLKITSDGRKLGLDPRLIDPSFEDNPDTKLNRCVENVARIHAETAEDKLTQIIFCDLGVPHKATGEATVEGDDADDAKDSKSIAEVESLEEECDFCVYDDIRAKLIAKGIPAEEIAYIHDAKTEKQKSELFDKVRSGEVRVLLGSTAKMGTGTNVQKRLIAVHDLDIPWRPADLEQRAGRIIRQGNENKNVQIFRYVTKGTFDAYSYQTLENKQKFISQIMTSKTPARKCEDVDQQALTYSEIKALCTGDERIKEKLMLENDVKELRVLATEHRNTVFEMEDKISRFPEQEQKLTAILDDLHTDREALRKLPIDPERKLPVFKITIGETEYTDRKEAAKALEDAVLAIKYADTPVKVGSFQGFDLSVTVNSNMMGGGMSACLKGDASHTTKLIESFAHNLNRLEAALYNIDGRIERTQENLAKLRLDHAEAQKIVAEPFPQQEELDTKEQRLKVVTDELNQAAIEAKKNAPKRNKTCYFERAKMKRDAARLAKKPKTPKDKAKGRGKQGIE